MNNNIIEIMVSGVTGSGKSEVCEVIAKALKAHYGRHDKVTIAGDVNEGAIESAKTTGQTAANAIFIIDEVNRQSATPTTPRRQW